MSEKIRVISVPHENRIENDFHVNNIKHNIPSSLTVHLNENKKKIYTLQVWLNNDLKQTWSCKRSINWDRTFIGFDILQKEQEINKPSGFS